MERLVLLCRAGFERECAAELTARADALGVPGAAPAAAGTAHVAFAAAAPQGCARLCAALPFAELVFARQMFHAKALLDDLPAGDRAGPIAGALAACGTRFGELLVQVADSPGGRELAGLARALRGPLRGALDRAGLLAEAPGLPWAHVLLLGGRSAFAGLADPANSSPWPGGIPRLRFPRGAPSRSALKLEEALHAFLDAGERAARLRPGLRAVDLGASPGGWTWVLAARGLRVTAVDNGPLHPRVLAEGAVEHRREDGFRYRPRRAVDWLTCDIADKPARVAHLVGAWLEAGLARAAIFNLKLPMRRRHEAVVQCRAALEAALGRAPGHWELRLRQLYHDREEVTGFAMRR